MSPESTCHEAKENLGWAEEILLRILSGMKEKNVFISATKKKKIFFLNFKNNTSSLFKNLEKAI